MGRVITACILLFPLLMIAGRSKIKNPIGVRTTINKSVKFADECDKELAKKVFIEEHKKQDTKDALPVSVTNGAGDSAQEVFTSITKEIKDLKDKKEIEEVAQALILLNVAVLIKEGN